MIKKWFQSLFKQSKVNPRVIIEAINDYRIDGKKLMHELGKKYGLDIKKTEDFEKLTLRNNEKIPRKGELSKRWNYYFHGLECGFYNKKHQQRVEVVLSNPPEFGHVDSWFLLSYMESTEKYKNEIKGIKWQELKSIIDGLYETGEIEAVNE